jgi:hypothetical protein
MSLVSCSVSSSAVTTTGMNARPVRGTMTVWYTSWVGRISTYGMRLYRNAGRTLAEK